MLASPKPLFSINRFEADTILFSPTETALSFTSVIMMSSKFTLEPLTSIASPPPIKLPIFLNWLEWIYPSEKSISIASDKVFLTNIFFILNFELIILRASSLKTF